MNRIFRLLVVCCLGSLLGSCDVVVKRMDAKVAETKQEVTQSAPETYESIELPAPLTSVPEQILVRKGYTVSYNKDRRVPNWVAWHLTAAHLKGSVKRSDASFHEDEEVPMPRAIDSDYVRSGYDRGHMCPAGDNKWSAKAMDESFLFTNVCPQAPQLNRGDWNEMEQACRKWAKENGDIYIVCGPIFYKKRAKTIGKNKVAVPDAFFKVVLTMKGKPKAIGFIYKNGDGNRPKGDYANSVDEVERITGIDFFPSLPDKIEKQVEAQCNPDDWNI
ncbi:DNA/RNA non-specific endonuclease [uncultured Prevotella sp.]|uniref:DNA/RNA non-specific endonuclease n=1 Tax=uncultured Prevotella sp. TaxID=159272 RepID=UPI0027E2D781|nr:DNA/RNA non-specific endonuclease [uncultured Prevotella sp.]